MRIPLVLLAAGVLMLSPIPSDAACPEGFVQTAATCGGVTEAGCCDAYQYVVLCHEGVLCTQDCGASLKQCGWNADRYSCGDTASADPDGLVPRECPCTPQCDGKACGPDGCGGNCGQCAPNDVCNDQGTCDCVPNCTDRECGSDGCGGDCGSCPSTFQWSCSNEGQCVCEPYCTGRECGPDGCGGSCGSCTLPLVCAAAKCQSKPCVPSCVAKECGSDGCEGTCGECEPGESCSLWGQCQPCTPQCDGRECGSDGCGSTCGQCLPGQTCDALGHCMGDCQPQCQGKVCGPDGCGGTCGDCAPGQTCDPLSGACDGEPCFPNCVMKECGPDGCGGSCGDCVAPAVCSEDFLCRPPCTPQCDGRECGDDGCGGSCGDCPDGASCFDGTCRTGPGDDAHSGADTGTAEIEPPAPCPPGHTYYYGQCVPTGSNRKSGGCVAAPSSERPAAPWLGIILGMTMLATIAVLHRRAARDRSERA